MVLNVTMLSAVVPAAALSDKTKPLPMRRGLNNYIDI